MCFGIFFLTSKKVVDFMKKTVKVRFRGKAFFFSTKFTFVQIYLSLDDSFTNLQTFAVFFSRSFTVVKRQFDEAG